MSSPDDPADRMTLAALGGRVAVLHTAKVCTNTVVHKMCPPLVRATLAEVGDRVTVGLVRHPLDRLVSGWADLTRPYRVHLIAENRYTHVPIPGVEAEMSLEAFVEVVERHPNANRHWIPQSRWVLIDGKLPSRLVRYEHLHGDWSELMREFPALPLFPLERLNASEHPSWEEALPPGQLRDRAAAIFADDLEVFGYSVP